MQLKPNSIWRFGAIICGLGVVLGAFGAHWLESNISEWYEPAEAAKKLNSWDTGVRYQLAHGLALLILGVVAERLLPMKKLQFACLFFLAGILLFSGSLYFWTLTDIKIFVMLVPFGGLSFILGWVCVAMLGIETTKHGKSNE